MTKAALTILEYERTSGSPSIPEAFSCAGVRSFFFLRSLRLPQAAHKGWLLTSTPHFQHESM